MSSNIGALGKAGSGPIGGNHPLPIGYRERSAFYDCEFGSFPDEVEFIASVGQMRGGNVLEVPCACGRLTLPLSRRVERITAVDRDPKMLLQLQRRLAARGGIENVKTVLEDMRFLKLSAMFDLIVCPRECFQLLGSETEALDALSSFKRHMSKRGCLVLDLATFARSSEPTEDGPEYFAAGLGDNELIAEWERGLDDGSLLRRSRSQRLRSNQLLELTFFYTLVNGALTEEFVSTVELRIYSLCQISALLQAAGFRMVEAYGNYRRVPVSENSARLLIVAEAT
ncbi:class I SAM-dependent methyltransferase [Bradyrhizobium arachidis]|nr:class I SAM-dependent methyltransferase [Bradyrhizobium arachidis]SFV13426.1 Methyltransferase domain-containing protein [Bradyrhizobium arachidis]